MRKLLQAFGEESGTCNVQMVQKTMAYFFLNLGVNEKKEPHDGSKTHNMRKDLVQLSKYVNLEKRGVAFKCHLRSSTKNKATTTNG